MVANRTELINNVIGALEKKLGSAQNELIRVVVTELVDSLDREGDSIKNTLRNKRLVQLVDNLYTKHAKSKGLDVSQAVARGVTQVVDFNHQYFGGMAPVTKLAPIHAQVKESLNGWLGITTQGNRAPNGYLDTIVQDPSIKQTIKNMVMKTVVSQGGYQQVKKELGDYIVGNEDTGKPGALQKYYRNFVYDTFSIADRSAAKIYADKLQFNYAIYEGGLIKTSRQFCKDRNGKVFSRDEIAEFDPPEAKPPGYNPFTDLGGYACRHHLNWIPDAVAFALRPDLKNKKPPAAPTVPAPAPKPLPPKPKPAAAPIPKTPPAPPPPARPTPPTPPAGNLTPAQTRALLTPDALRKNLYKKVKDHKEAEPLVKDMFAQLGFNAKAEKFGARMTPEKLNKYLKQLGKLTSEYFVGEWANTSSHQVAVLFESTAKSHGAVTSTKDGRRIFKANFGDGTSQRSHREYIQWGNLREKSRVDQEHNEIATLTHEFAHVMSVSEHNSEFFSEIRTLKAQYTAEVKKLKNLSGRLNEIYLGHYASTNADEFWAEAWTEYKLSSKPSKYAKLVGKLAEKFFSKKKPK